ncbi:MAG TPA: hypothetical protein VIY27_10135 [Myxococcota bacterium]
MADSAYLLELLAGTFYVVAAIRLFLLSSSSGQRPERLLGLTFLLMGVSYLFYEIPFALESEALLISFSVAGRACYAASVITVALFTRHVFHGDRAWSGWMVGCAAGLLCAGFAVSGSYGDWEGLAPLSNPGFWLEWLGQSIPFAWVGAAAFGEYAKARRRLRLGLSDSVVCNRYLLFGLFGLLQLCTLLLLIPMYIHFETTGTWARWADNLLGTLEIMTIGAIWLAFFPPALYRHWLCGAAPSLTGGD